jgi:hypothetical protein
MLVYDPRRPNQLQSKRSPDEPQARLRASSTRYGDIRVCSFVMTRTAEWPHTRVTLKRELHPERGSPVTRR